MGISLDHPTTTELLEDVAEQAPGRIALRYLPDGVDAEEWTYGELLERLREWADVIADSARPGTRALLLLPSDRDYALAFLASVYAGVVPVPIGLPESGRIHRVREHVGHVVADCEPNLVLSVRRILSMAGDDPLLRARTSIALDEPPAPGTTFLPPRRTRDDLAFVQYTSGSTRAPKGVCNTHASLLHQVEYMEYVQRVVRGEESMHIVSWLPLYHDMGLIFGFLGPLLTGGTATLMRPGSFAGDPRRWFQAISRYRGNGTCGPDFSYRVCCDAFADEEVAELDLSCMRYMGNGAEPIRPLTMARVRDRFAPAGLPPASLSAAYGLAEAGLIVSTSAEPRRHRVSHYDPDALSAGRADRLPAGTGRSLAGCGDFTYRWRVAVADPETGAELPPGRTGEIWVAGPGMPAGYWNRPYETDQTFHAYLADGAGPFLRTGDIGFFDAGELYVCGRWKDLVIVRGANHYPNDLELSLELHVDPIGVGGACVVQTDGRLLVLVEVSRSSGSQVFDTVVERICAVLADEHQLAADEIVLVRRGILPRTSSGKVRRQATGSQYRAGELSTLHVDATDDVGTEEPTWPTVSTGPTLDALRDAVAGFLGVPPVEIRDDTNLIQAGLDSMMVFRLAAQFGYTGADVEFHELFEHPTLRGWADLVSSRTPTVTPTTDDPLEDGSV